MKVNLLLGLATLPILAFGQANNPFNHPTTYLSCQVTGTAWGEPFNSAITVRLVDAKYETRIYLEGNKDFGSYDDVVVDKEKYSSSYKNESIQKGVGGRNERVTNTGRVEINRMTGNFYLKQYAMYPDKTYTVEASGNCQKTTNQKF